MKHPTKIKRPPSREVREDIELGWFASLFHQSWNYVVAGCRPWGACKIWRRR